MGWKDRAEVVDPQAVNTQGSWKDRAEVVTSPDEGISKLETAIRAGAGDFTFGYGDELAGGAMAAGQFLKGQLGLGKDWEAEDLPMLYKTNRDAIRQRDKEAIAANPKTALGSQIAATALTNFLPGAGMLNAAKGAKVGTIAGKAALEGGIYSLGKSEADNVKDMALDTLGGAATNAVTGVVFNQAGKAIGKGWDSFKKSKPVTKVSKFIGNVLFDLPGEYTEKILDNPKVLDSVRSVDELEDGIVWGANRLRDAIGEADTEAWNTLSKNKDMPATGFVDSIKDELKKNLIEDSAFAKDKMALRKAEEIMEYLQKKEILSEDDLKSVIKKIDAETNWEKQEFATANNFLQRVRTEFDGILKNKNPNYMEAMAPVEAKVRQLNKLSKDLVLRKGAKGYIEPTDTTKTKLKSLYDAAGKSKRRHAEGNLRALNEFAPGKQGLNIADELKLRRIQDATEGGVTNGSRNVLAGTITGATAGGGIGAVTGGLAGYLKDKYGRKIGKEVVKASSKAVKAGDRILENIPAMPEKYRAMLENAARRGMLPVIHSTMLKNDAEYSRAYNDAENKKQDAQAVDSFLQNN